MRRGFGLFWVALTGLIVGFAAWAAYNAGLAANVANNGHATVVYEGGGFGFFPFLLFFLLILFLFRRRRWGGHWGGRGWSGYGHGWDGKQNWEVPPVIDEKLKSWHEKAHGNAPAEPAGGDPAAKQPGS
jgi:hypothetical protein